MGISSVIILFALAVSLVLYIVSLIKDWKIINGITSFLFIPLTCTPAILALNNYVPDALNLRSLTIAAVALISISELFIYFRFRAELIIPGELLYTFSLLVWISIYKSTFYVFRATNLTLICESIFLIIILLALFIYLGKQPLYKYPLKIVQIGALGFLNYCGLLTIIYTHKNYGFTLLAGSLLMIAEFILYSIQTTKPVNVNKKIQRTVRTTVMTCAEVLLTLTGFLMISN